MPEYTDQEIEMLARFAHEASGDASTWDSLRDERKRDMRAYAIEKTSQHTLRSPIVRAAARLMRAAREQGAAEMRERAANLLLDVCHDHPSTREIAANIRSLPLAVPQ